MSEFWTSEQERIEQERKENERLRQERDNEFARIRRKEESMDKVTSILALALFIVVLLSVPLVIIPVTRSNNELIVEKDTIKRTISVIIKNGASLDLVKHVYSERKREHPPIYAEYDHNLYCSIDTPLSTILSELCVGYFSAQEYGSDSLYYSRLADIARENLYRNPFDNLEEPQSELFKALRLKIGDGYDSVQEDVLKIATELENKNQLVSEYLNDSKTGFWTSISALIITIVFSVAQIIQNIKTGRKLSLLADRKEDKKDGQ